ncbi:TonB-dependent receptor [Algibacillus agarilyticus]|uniref:TonB-dependent receptor n=1 Tax=Algibacillus agarilyticus TaxID=2234133 RepID=UPI000DD06B30|nr:TonB-dependent receptor [Algibacillus agarilyticus]
MYNNKFKLNSVLLAVLCATHAQAQSQENSQNNNVEVIEVKGIASSLSKSAAMKRDGQGVVDAISAEDIGKFPDTNLAESLQRITGVSIDRSNNEGNKVTVRGFGPSFNLVTLNGRQMPNSSALLDDGISRSFNFKEVGAESVSAVAVHKTARADLNSGGIGATIDIQTAKPFDHDGFKALGSVKGVLDTSVDTGDSITPEISGMISNTFLDDSVGVLISASHAVRHSHTDRIGRSGQWSDVGKGSYDNWKQAFSDTPSVINTSNINTANNSDQHVFTAPTVDFEKSDSERERQNAQVVLQYSPNADLVITADYVLSRLDDKQKMNRSSFWFDGVDTGTADVNGTLINPTRAKDELNFWAWEYAYKTENDSMGINVEWQATDALSLTLDLHDSTSHSNPGGLPAERLANLKNPRFDHDNDDHLADDGDDATTPTPHIGYVDIAADFTGNTPSISYDDSELIAKTGNDAWHKSNIVGDLIQERGYEIENNIKQLSLSARWENLGNGDLTAINFGLNNTVYKVDTTKISGAVWNTSALDLTNLDIETTPGGIGFDSVLRYSADQFIALTKDPANNMSDPTKALYAAPNESLNGIEEDSTAFYVSFDFESEFNDMPIYANFGVRHESTDITAYTVAKPVEGLKWITALEMSKIFADDAVSDQLSGNYSHYLPSLNIKMDINDDVVARFSYGNTIARSDIGSLFPETSLQTHLAGGPFTAKQGNPNLLPYEAKNLDLSLEWYYSEGSYASIGHFRKDVDNFISNGIVDRTINDANGNPITDPSQGARAGCPAPENTACESQPSDPAIMWRVETPVNLDALSVKGWEFNIQHMFADTGFGAIANYTIVDSDNEYDVHDLDNKLVLTGLSDTANLVGFYENDSMSFRIAYNWRDDFLLNATDRPTFTEAYSQIDVSASYDINDSVSVFIDGINITDEDTRRHGRFANQLVDFEQYGARYNIGVRATFE